MKVKVNTTEDDINNGRRCNSNSCPIALSVARVTGAESVAVDLTTVSICKEDCYYPHIILPKKAQHFVWRFDRKGKGKPFSFWLKYKD